MSIHLSTTYISHYTLFCYVFILPHPTNVFLVVQLHRHMIKAQVWLKHRSYSVSRGWNLNLKSEKQQLYSLFPAAEILLLFVNVGKALEYILIWFNALLHAVSTCGCFVDRDATVVKFPATLKMIHLFTIKTTHRWWHLRLAGGPAV